MPSQRKGNGHAKNRGPGQAAGTPGGPVAGARCGAVTRAPHYRGEGEPGRPCALPSGWGTPNRSGPCKLHGGATASVQSRYAAIDREREASRELQKLGLWGNRRADLSATEALSEELSRTGGRVAALEGRLVELEARGTESLTARSLAEQLALERTHLRTVAEAASRCGVAEAQQRLSEDHGQLLVAVIRGLLGDLELSPEQQYVAPAIAGWHLRRIADPSTAGERPPLPSSYRASQALLSAAVDAVSDEPAEPPPPPEPQVPEDEPTVTAVRSVVSDLNSRREHHARTR